MDEKVSPLEGVTETNCPHRIETVEFLGIIIMVQERNLERPKFQARDIDQRLRRPNVKSNVSGTGSGSNLATDTATGLALLLSIVSFFFSSVAVVQAVRTQRNTEAILQAANRPAATPVTNSGSQTIRRSAALPGDLPPIAQRIEPGRFVQPIHDGAGQIELLSANRVNGASDSNVVNLKMRVQRMRDQVRGLSDINLAQTVAINSRTNQRYSTLDFRTRFGDALSLRNLRPGDSAEATVTLRVPEGLNRVDLQIPGTVLFQGVPIVTAASVPNAR